MTSETTDATVMGMVVGRDQEYALVRILLESGHLVSCYEGAFFSGRPNRKPRLGDKVRVVTRNGDGCVIARSARVVPEEGE